MLIKKNNVETKMKTDKAFVHEMSIEDIQNALVELGELITSQEDALVELASIISGETEE